MNLWLHYREFFLENLSSIWSLHHLCNCWLGIINFQLSPTLSTLDVNIWPVDYTNYLNIGHEFPKVYTYYSNLDHESLTFSLNLFGQRWPWIFDIHKFLTSTTVNNYLKITQIKDLIFDFWYLLRHENNLKRLMIICKNSLRKIVRR